MEDVNQVLLIDLVNVQRCGAPLGIFLSRQRPAGLSSLPTECDAVVESHKIRVVKRKEHRLTAAMNHMLELKEVDKGPTRLEDQGSVLEFSQVKLSFMMKEGKKLFKESLF